MYTFYTSFLFGLVAVVAQTTRYTSLFYLNHLLYGLSILHHAKFYEPVYVGKKIIAIVDKITAHSIAILTSYIAITHPEPDTYLMSIYWGSLVWVFLVFYVLQKSQLPGTLWEPWHASIHIMGAIGQLALLAQ
jgi:hypothetical protein